MKEIHVTLKGKNFKIFQVEYMGKSVNVAEPRLEEAIQRCIENNEYCDSIASIGKKMCTVEDVSNLYEYVYGEDEPNPTEQDVIDSISDVWE